jgi:chorismate mutase/prephenate dehydratase
MAKKDQPKKTASPPSPQKATKPPAVSPSVSKVSTTSLEAEAKRLDREIIKLVNRRAEVATKFIQAQPNPGKAVFTPFADDELLDLIEKQNPGPLPIAAVRSIFREIVTGAKSAVKTLRIAYLGPAYSFTHLAAMERFGSAASFIPVANIASVFEEVNRGHADYGMAPIENSTDGRVVDTLDMFTRLPLKICGEVQLAIHHHLMSRSPRAEVTEIYSKPQALSQCREWLARNMPHAQCIEVTSTSTAAQVARDKPGAAAVASRQAAQQYDLQIVAESIEDNKHNVTRFAVIGDETTKPTGRDKTAILLQIKHEPGSLADTLTTFKKANLNLTWIESFPLKGPESGYLFFLEFEGHASQAPVQKILQELQKRAIRLEILGSFPSRKPIG